MAQEMEIPQKMTKGDGTPDGVETGVGEDITSELIFAWAE